MCVCVCERACACDPTEKLSPVKKAELDKAIWAMFPAETGTGLEPALPPMLLGTVLGNAQHRPEPPLTLCCQQTESQLSVCLQVPSPHGSIPLCVNTAQATRPCPGIYAGPILNKQKPRDKGQHLSPCCPPFQPANLFLVPRSLRLSSSICEMG